MPHKNYLLIFWFALAIVVLLSFLPLNTLGSIEFQDKLQHAIAYAALYLLSIKAFAGRFHVWMLAFFFVGLGVLVEFAQSLTEYRKNDVWDALANATGVLLTAVALSLSNKTNDLKTISHDKTAGSPDK
jgi:VanZ family protein